MKKMAVTAVAIKAKATPAAPERLEINKRGECGKRVRKCSAGARSILGFVSINLGDDSGPGA